MALITPTDVAKTYGAHRPLAGIERPDAGERVLRSGTRVGFDAGVGLPGPDVICGTLSGGEARRTALAERDVR